MFEVLETIRGGGCKAAVVADAHTIEPRNVITIFGLEHYFDITVISERLVSRSPPGGIPGCIINSYWSTTNAKEVI
jgi:hypothetical protein